MSAYHNQNHENQSKSQISSISENNTNLEKESTVINQDNDPKYNKSDYFKPRKTFQGASSESKALKPEHLQGTKNMKKELAPNQWKSTFRQFKSQTISILAGAAVMLPIITIPIVGMVTASHYFGREGIDKQPVSEKILKNPNLPQIKLTQQKNLLTALLIGTEAIALVAGIMAALRVQQFVSDKISDSEPEIETTGTEANLDSSSLSESEIERTFLQDIVEEARNSLDCDRVLVYSLDQADYGMVVAESVVDDYTQALGKIIADPCFQAKYGDQYRDGRIQVINNVAEAKMTACHREQLQQLEIKANLVVPIVGEDKLFGLIVANQCREPREWQKSEIELLKQFASRIPLIFSNGKLSNDATHLETLIQREREWTNYFTDIVQYIRQSLEPKDILKVTVDEVRQVMQCDRVLVYSLNEDRYGTVIAESVVPGYTRALNKVISDPCFETKYLEKYCDGRVRALDNIYEAEIPLCYLEQLEALDVRANLVTPIINDGKIFGLLVAHQCSESRHWQDYEIRWLTQIATQVAFALDNAKMLAVAREKDALAKREREWTNYFTDVVQYIRESLEQKDILDITVEEVRRVMRCDRVLVYSLNEDRYGTVIAESVAAKYTRALNKVISDPCFETRYLEKYRDGRVRALDNIYEAEIPLCYLEQLESLQVKANLVTPIINEGKIFGLLVAHQCGESRQWQDYEIRWLTQIATQVGFALDNAKVLAVAREKDALAKREREWTNYFTDVVQYIRQSLEQKDLLKVTVDEVRQVMQCDRVLVYSLNDDRYGTVIAESVAAKYTKALNKVISDPCFETEYLEKYRDGRVRALDNIYEAEIPLCYLEQLEALEVKANLVTPIINEGKIFGLLVAHQCGESRHWQDYEIRWLTQIATQVGFALDNAKILRELNSQNISTQLLNSFIFKTRDCLDRVELFKTTVEQICLGMSLDRVIVYQFDAEWNGTIISESVVPDYPKSLNSHIQDSCFAQKYQEKYLQGYVKAISNIHEANLTECYLEKLEFLAVKAIIIAPIIENGALFGLLIGHQCSQTRDWESSEIELFYQLTLQLGLALERIALKEELSLKQYMPENQATQPLLEQQESFPKKISELQKISELLVENQHTLHKIKAKIGNKSSNKTSLVNNIEAENHDSITIANDEEP